MAAKKRQPIRKSNTLLIALLTLLGISIVLFIIVNPRRSATPLSLNQLEESGLISGPGCMIDGCFNELCLNSGGKRMLPACKPSDERKEFACYAQYGLCQKQASGDCGWEQTPALLSCLKPEVKPTPTPTPDGNKPTPPPSDNNNPPSDVNACRDQAPSTPANLYQINVTNTDAILYFAPAGKPYSRYIVQYGENKTMQHSANFDAKDATGALSATIHSLKPNMIYTFRIQAFNNCAPGPWSNSLTVKTTAGATRIFYKNSSISLLASPKPTLTPTKSAKATPTSTTAPDPIAPEPTPITYDYQPPQPQLSLLQQIWKFITNLLVH